MQWRCDKCGHLGALSKTALLWGSGSTVPRLRCERCGLTSVFGGGQIVAGDDVPPDQEPASPPEAPPERGPAADGAGLALLLGIVLPGVWIASNVMTYSMGGGGYIPVVARLALGMNGLVGGALLGAIALATHSRAAPSPAARAWWAVVHVPIIIGAILTACAAVVGAWNVGSRVGIDLALMPFLVVLPAGALWAVYALGLWITAPTARTTTR